MNYEEAKVKYELDSVQGWMDECDMVWLFEKAKEFNNSTIVEIGSWKGRSTGAILSGLSESNKMYCVDTWAGTDGEDGSYDDAENAFNIFNNHIERFIVRPIIIRGDSADSADQFKEGSIDWVFLDANHSTEGVLRDLRKWHSKVKNGGVFSGHDWQWESVRKALSIYKIEIYGFTTQERNGLHIGSIWWSK